MRKSATAARKDLERLTIQELEGRSARLLESHRTISAIRSDSHILLEEHAAIERELIDRLIGIGRSLLSSASEAPRFIPVAYIGSRRLVLGGGE